MTPPATHRLGCLSLAVPFGPCTCGERPEAEERSALLVSLQATMLAAGGGSLTISLVDERWLAVLDLPGRPRVRATEDRLLATLRELVRASGSPLGAGAADLRLEGDEEGERP